MGKIRTCGDAPSNTVERRQLEPATAARAAVFEGIGKPEPLRHDLAGLWSHRIDEKNRLVYGPTTDALIVHQCRYHYTA
ncbi:Txe/YoeB family addiction module toxin [Streptomyces sp. ISL-66]|nr:Txe/YoeB family addiction module toxin [Streptomyces sp. ISL-66]